MQLNFSDSESRVYVIDTSGLIKLESTFPKNMVAFFAVWEEIEDLVQKGRFKTLDFVEEEINSYQGKKDFLKLWVKHWRKKLVQATSEECFNAAIPIINEEYATGFFDSKKQAEGKEEADPYLIAYCKVNSCTLITDENKNKPNKIPSVAKRHGVSCFDVYEFLSDRELKMERKRSE